MGGQGQPPSFGLPNMLRIIIGELQHNGEPAPATVEATTGAAAVAATAVAAAACCTHFCLSPLFLPLFFCTTNELRGEGGRGGEKAFIPL